MVKYCFQNICRTCASVNDSLHDVPDSKRNSYSDFLQAFGNNIIDYGIQIPNKLCSPCLDKLHTCIDFRTQIENANVYFQETLNRLREEEKKSDRCSGDSDIDDKSETVSGFLYETSDDTSDGKPLQEIKNESSNVSVKSLHTCSKCKTSFHSREHLTEHNAQHESQIEDCLYCTTKFVDSREIVPHIQAEHRNLKYNCGYCNTKFDYVRLLELHIATHLSVTPQEINQNQSINDNDNKLKSADSSSDDSIQTKRKKPKRKCLKRKIEQKIKNKATLELSPPLSPATDLITSPDSIEDDSDKDLDYNLNDSKKKQDEVFCENPQMEAVQTVIQSNITVIDTDSDSTCNKINEPSSREEVKTNTNKPKKIRHVDYCFYCEQEVLNFARHLQRHHRHETEVRKILSLPRKTKERKNYFTALRKRGNYLRGDLIKPMKRSKQKHIKGENYLPCSRCLGFYSRKLLWKHRQKCRDNLGNSSRRVQADAQSFLVRHKNIDPKLKELVFPTMRPDKISLTAKMDMLICALGSKYLKIHKNNKDIHIIYGASRKMRELARLLIEIQKFQPTIQNLVEALQPENYDVIVEAAKAIAKYNFETHMYELPTIAMNIGTSLKQCCNIATEYYLTKNEPDSCIDVSELESNLKTTLHQLKTSWRSKILNLAVDDPNYKEENKITLTALARDIQILNEHLTSKSSQAASRLQKNTSEIDYSELSETIYCRLLLMNRRTPWELQRLLLNTYEKSETVEHKYVDFDRDLSVTERVLLSRLKLLIIRGQRGRGVPVLFDLDVQKDIALLIEIRDKFVPKCNVYLFGKPGHDSTLSGYEVFEKHTKESGIVNLNALSSTELRKDLATLNQIFNMTETDKKQLATFIGIAAHNGTNCLIGDVYETAKIAKLVLMMEEGKTDQYKGMTLDEIDIDLEEEITCEEDSCLPNKATCDDPLECDEYSVTKTRKQDDPAPPLESIALETCKKRRELIPWTDEQKKLTQTFFKQHIKARKPPIKHECDKLIKNNSAVFHNKNWLKIKVFVQNVYSKKNNSMTSMKKRL